MTSKPILGLEKEKGVPGGGGPEGGGVKPRRSVFSLLCLSLSLVVSPPSALQRGEGLPKGVLRISVHSLASSASAPLCIPSRSPLPEAQGTEEFIFLFFWCPGPPSPQANGCSARRSGNGVLASDRLRGTGGGRNGRKDSEPHCSHELRRHDLGTLSNHARMDSVDTAQDSEPHCSHEPRRHGLRDCPLRCKSLKLTSTSAGPSRPETLSCEGRQHLKGLRTSPSTSAYPLLGPLGHKRSAAGSPAPEGSSNFSVDLAASFEEELRVKFVFPLRPAAQNSGALKARNLRRELRLSTPTCSSQLWSTQGPELLRG